MCPQPVGVMGLFSERPVVVRVLCRKVALVSVGVLALGHRVAIQLHHTSQMTSPEFSMGRCNLNRYITVTEQRKIGIVQKPGSAQFPCFKPLQDIFFGVFHAFKINSNAYFAAVKVNAL